MNALKIDRSDEEEDEKEGKENVTVGVVLNLSCRYSEE